ncbi:hypothetical protein VTN02DRAFT_3069 [Thermoascus thermophilus]
MSCAAWRGRSVFFSLLLSSLRWRVEKRSWISVGNLGNQLISRVYKVLGSWTPAQHLCSVLVVVLSSYSPRAEKNLGVKNVAKSIICKPCASVPLDNTYAFGHIVAPEKLLKRSTTHAMLLVLYAYAAVCPPASSPTLSPVSFSVETMNKPAVDISA